MTSQPPAHPTRRNIVKGAVWSVPVATMATVAPVFAGSQPASGTVAGPWRNTWPSNRDGIDGDGGGIGSYIIMGTTEPSGTAAFDQSTADNAAFDVDGTGSYECDPEAATYGAGDQITITITENLGTYYSETPLNESQTAPGPAAWPDLILRDAACIP